MRRFMLTAATATAVLATAVPTSMPASAATPPLKFGTFVADPKGNDLPMSTAKLNSESIVVTNTTTKSIGLGGYKVYDAGRKFTYTFPRGYTIGAKKSVVLHTGSGSNSTAHVYWGQKKTYIWNNTGDTATLINATGTRLTTCTYKKVNSGIKAC